VVGHGQPEAEGEVSYVIDSEGNFLQREKSEFWEAFATQREKNNNNEDLGVMTGKSFKMLN
jgi:hypothetical protein